MNYKSNKNSLKNRLPLKLYMHGTHKFVLSCHASYSPPALSFSDSFFSLFSFLSFYSPHLFILHFFLQHKASISSFFLSFFPTPAKKTFQETNFSIQTIPTNNSHKLFNSNNSHKQQPQTFQFKQSPTQCNEKSFHFHLLHPLLNPRHCPRQHQHRHFHSHPPQQQASLGGALQK